MYVLNHFKYKISPNINMTLTDRDLRNKKYTLDELRMNATQLSISTLLKWQTLDADFCKEYILNEEYQSVEEQYMVDINYVLKMQPHLKYEDFY